MQNFAYGYDPVGNVSGRTDLINSVSETFGYDALDRLTASTVTNGTGPRPVTFAYDDAAGNLGNMTHKSDISTLPSASMSYSPTARPHALTSLNTGSATRTFAYNANGAITGGQVASGTRTLAYTSYDLLASATIGTTSRTFSYGPDRAPDRQVTATTIDAASGRLRRCRTSPTATTVSATSAVAPISSTASRRPSATTRSIGLTASTVTNGTGPHPVTYAYDDAAGNLGNMTHKSDISTLPSASMSYSTTARPHALTSLNIGSATRTFAYNANGAITGGQVASGTRTLAYTSYEMLASATIGTTSRTFSYGPDRQRYRQVSVSGGTTRTYTYIGEHFVKEVQGSATEHKLYILANGEPVAYVSDDGTPETRYLHKDHLGSITTIVTNQNVLRVKFISSSGKEVDLTETGLGELAGWYMGKRRLARHVPSGACPRRFWRPRQPLIERPNSLNTPPHVSSASA